MTKRAAKREPKFTIYPVCTGPGWSRRRWYWKLVGANGERMCQGEPHPSAALARRAIARIKRAAAGAKVEVER